MASLGKKARYVAPGKIGTSLGQGLKEIFLSGGIFHTSPSTPGDKLSSKSINTTNSLTNSLVSNSAPVSNVVGVVNATAISNVVGAFNAPVSNGVAPVSNGVAPVSNGTAASNATAMSNDSNVAGISKKDQVSNVQASKEKYGPSNATFSKTLNDTSNKEERLQRSIANTNALSEFLDQVSPQVNTTTHQIDSQANGNTHEEEVSNLVVTRKRNRKPGAKGRGGNKCKKVANLREGERLEVQYYNNGPVGDNHTDMTRHMGKLVRDRTICPVRVHSWDGIEESAKEHMWQSVLNKFSGKDVPLDRHTSLLHMRRLWHNWRGILHQNSIIKKGGPKNALKETPKDLTSDDWKWLVNEHFTSKNFKKVSSTNSSNRQNLKMPHRTGSKPFRQIIWNDMGGKDGVQPPISDVFKKTRAKKDGKLGEDEATKYDEIVVETHNPSLLEFDVVEKCFGEQARGGVACFGFGLKPKDVRGPLPTRVELTTSLHEKQRENDDLRKRLDEMEKTRQEEREGDKKKMNDLEEKLNKFMAIYLEHYNPTSDNLKNHIGESA